MERVNNYIYDFISAGKTGRDYHCMIEAAKRLKNSKFVIITDLLKKTYSNNVEIISGDISKKNSISADDTFRYYNKSKFIVIPVSLEHSSGQDVLAGLTSFVDAAVMGKPVLISDNTNMGIDVKKLGIGLIYKAGNVNDMADKMKSLMSLNEAEYNKMCDNMREYSKTHNYNVFCKNIVDIIKEEI